MKKINLIKYIAIPCLALLAGCGIPKLQEKVVDKNTPSAYINQGDTNTIAKIDWRSFFNDTVLKSYIDTALNNNQELAMVMQEIYMNQNEVLAKKGELMPFLNIGGGAGVEKVPRFTRDGAVEANIDIDEGKEFPEPLQDYNLQLNASWEVDIWRKLRNSRDAAVARYLASVEGKNFMETQLVAEVADAYYELLSLDNQLAIVQEYIAIQNNALKTVRIQKQSGDATELAVKKFEAEVLNTKTEQFNIQQEIVVTENRINFLLGRYPQPIQRDSQTFAKDLPMQLSAGVPSQLLMYRPDIRAAELNLSASKLDVKVARALFYPKLDISAGLGLGAFNPTYFATMPESMLFSLAGDAMAPLLNRKAIKATYMNANARQMQAVTQFEQTVLKAYLEVYNQVSSLNNLENSYAMKNQEVEALTSSISIASDLFRSARADYMEVLMTQRDALDSKLELVEYKKAQFLSMIGLYQTLGGGWTE